MERNKKVNMTIKDAKKFFLKYDGSLFGMAIEEQEVYESFKLLNIPNETLKKWRQELFLSLWKQLKENGSGRLFNRMYNISCGQHNRENLFIMKEALYKVNYNEPIINAYISETVLGRKALSERSGIIFWAYDLGEKKIAKELMQFVLNLVTVETSDEKIIERFEWIIKTCNLISSELNL